MREVSPFFQALIALARLEYGDALDYTEACEFDDRAEAAAALCEAGAVRKRATKDAKTGKVLAWTYSVDSQQHKRGEKLFYHVEPSGVPSCECRDWQYRMRNRFAILERWGNQSIVLPLVVPCKHLTALRWMLALEAAFPSIQIEDEQDTKNECLMQALS